MTTTITDEYDLMERAKTDKEAFGEIYEIYFQRLFKFFYYRTGNTDESYDLVAGTFEKLIRNIDSFHPQKKVPVSAWIFRIARNLLIDHSRKVQHRQHTPLEDVSAFMADSSASPETLADHQLQLSLVRQAIARMKDKYREVLTLRFFDEMTNQEIADLLGKKKEQVALEVFRGLGRLRRILAVIQLEVSHE